MTDRKRTLAPLVCIVGGLMLGLGVGLLLRPAAEEPAGPNAADIGFAQDMAVHHGQALVMADFAIDRAQSPQVRAMARQILVAQAGERGLLQGWLTMWKAPQLPVGEPMTWVPDRRGTHGHAMPGMATTAELQRLGEMEGRSFDREFAVLMTRHHEGGIVMAKAARQRASLSDVRSLAASMVRQQAEEVAQLRLFLAPAGR